MYPEQELTRLAAHKAVLQRTIARRRVHCVAAATQVMRPLAWLDQLLASWRRFTPLAQLAVIPLGLLAKRTVFPRLKNFGSIIRWGPLVFAAVRGIRSAIKSHRGSAKA